MQEEQRISLKEKSNGKIDKVKKLSWRSILGILIIVVLIPAILIISWQFSDRKFYLTSLIVILLSMAPFFMMFEKRKPQARELVILAVMCAIAVASRVAFIWLPHFSPIIAIIMISGIAFGHEAGFMIGSISALVSNFIFGQTMNTPWQMFAYGMAGLIVGLLYEKGLLSKRKFSFCAWAFLIRMIVGLILDTGVILISMGMANPNSSIWAVYLAGVPVNFMQSVATIITIIFVATPMFEKLDRIKTKYGMTEDLK